MVSQKLELSSDDESSRTTVGSKVEGAGGRAGETVDLAHAVPIDGANYRNIDSADPLVDILGFRVIGRMRAGDFDG